MSAKRYSGDAVITVSIDDSFERREPGRQSYAYTVTQGSNRSRGFISAPFTRRAIDAPEVFDEIARSALSFATHDKEIDEDTLDFGDEGYVVYRKKQHWHR
jgi:hypothetical protein